jgi:hypothetical protein
MTDNPFLEREDVPICFDTCAIYGDIEGPRLLEKLRERFPERELIIPAWVVAEKLRQMKRDKGAKFDMSRVQLFLSDPDLKLRVMPFSLETATDSWLEVVGDFTEDNWSWERLPNQYTPRPCAQRCRSGDHIVYAIARAHRALLVTQDQGLITQVMQDGYVPGTADIPALKSMLAIRMA